MDNFTLYIVGYLTVIFIGLIILYFPLMQITIRNRTYYPTQWNSGFTTEQINELIHAYKNNRHHHKYNFSPADLLGIYPIQTKVITTVLLLFWPIVFIGSIIVLLGLMWCLIYEYHMVGIVNAIEVNS